MEHVQSASETYMRYKYCGTSYQLTTIHLLIMSQEWRESTREMAH